MGLDVISYNKLNHLESFIQTIPINNIIKYQTVQTISANKNISIDLSTQNIDGTKALIEILLKDDDSNSDTNGTFINSTTIVKSISTDGKTLKVYNNNDKDKDVMIKIIHIA